MPELLGPGDESCDSRGPPPRFPPGERPFPPEKWAAAPGADPASARHRPGSRTFFGFAPRRGITYRRARAQERN